MAFSTSHKPSDRGTDFFPVSPLMIFPEAQGNFEVYVAIKGQYVLYCKQNERLNPEKRRKLHEDGVDFVYILKTQRHGYDAYIQANLAQTLRNEELPLKERAFVLYSASINTVEEFFEAGLPPSLKRRKLRDVISLVKESLDFLTIPQALSKLATLISCNYGLYAHSVNTLTLTAAVLQTYNPAHKTLRNACIGALLHDIGKMSWTRNQFDRDAARIKALEFEAPDPHPSVGAAYCAALPISREILACILLHHERVDGKGYPGGVNGEEIPFHVKALSLVNMYDRLTSKEQGGAALAPFDALKTIKSSLSGAFDPEQIGRASCRERV